MTRFKLIIEYEGSPFSGWQRQEDLPTVQGILEDVFQDFLGTTLVTIWGSGRTDAGVHAKGQVAHIDIEKPYTTLAIQGAINKRLHHVPIRLLNVEKVPSHFHARFSATQRFYEYVIFNRRTSSVLEAKRAWWVARSLSVEAMQEGAAYLMGHHDFSSFRDTRCQASSPMKTLEALSIQKEGEKIFIRTRARSFLHHQVRNMVGTLKRIGDGSWPPEKMRDILEARDRRAGGPTAPACGLYLTHIEF